MKIATWNVNSVRTRLEHLVDWLKVNPIEVVCLQETKVVDPDFPRSPLEELGYHVYISGQKSYNGVAILSRTPLTNVSAGFTPILEGSAKPELLTELDQQKRVLTGVVDGVQIVNLYVPNGSAVGSDKYEYKLRWLTVLRQYLQRLLDQSDTISICGDFNIALEDKDVYKSEGLATHIMSSEPERQALRQMMDLGFADAFRKFTQEGGHFSWWDYRTGAFQRNMGWRIDHHYLSPILYERAIACTIDPAPRKLVKPSDHTPVILELG